jgi:hypothetical protein
MKICIRRASALRIFYLSLFLGDLLLEDLVLPHSVDAFFFAARTADARFLLSLFSDPTSVCELLCVDFLASLSFVLLFFAAIFFTPYGF